MAPIEKEPQPGSGGARKVNGCAQVGFCGSEVRILYAARSTMLRAAHVYQSGAAKSRIRITVRIISMLQRSM